ncbi:MAG: tyrosine-type recombinase/integrase [Actinomycetaceae bacterium]|nr:tyrosine-type recombinase/integrase [Actinomycetaceae bacterium]
MTKRARFGTIKPTRNHRWEASHADPTRPGSRVYKRFDTKREASAWLAMNEHAIRAGTWESPHPRQDTTHTLTDWAVAWLAELEKAGASPNTLRSYLSACRCHILPTLGDVRLPELTPGHIEHWYEDFDPAHPFVRWNSYRCLHAMLNAAVEADLIKTSPARIKGALVRPKITPEKREARERIANPTQIAEIAESMPDDLGVFVYLAGWCGLRYGEIAALRRRDVDLAAGVIRVRYAVKRSPSGGLVIGPPKSESSRRDVPIAAPVMPVLRAWLDSTDGGDDDLVFRASNGSPVANNRLTYHYRRAVDKVPGLEGLTFHQLRATCASQLMATGATPVEIMAILGHSDWSTSLLYQRAPRERLAEAMRRLSEDAR